MDTNNWPQPGAPDPTIEQQGEVDGGRVFINDEPADDRPVHLTYPMPMPNANGDVAMFLTRVYARGYVDLYFVARRASDPANQMHAPLSPLRLGLAGVENPTFWGEYQGIALDPDGVRFWATGELGRCLEAVPLSPCPECPDGSFTPPRKQSNWHTAIGSYLVPAQSSKLLTVGRHDGTCPPVTINVKVAPPDVTNAIDVALPVNGGAQARTYGHGTVVILRTDKIPGYDFLHWLLDDVPVPPPPGTEPRQLTVSMTAAHSVKPVYGNCP